MSDRELLEFAAKAAGVHGRFFEITPLDGYPTYSCGIGYQSRSTRPWNPLTDDGDALRLAVKLHMLVDADGAAYAIATARPKASGIMVSEKHKDDPYAATRRAIVRAAAEIGKAKS